MPGGNEGEFSGEIPGGESGEVSGDDEASYPQEDLNIQTGYYLYNGHGDVISIVSNENKEYNKYEYDEYGQVEEEKEDIENVYKYAGYIQDKRTKNYYLNARYYNPAIQRFISEDTERGNKEDPLSLNLYTYTHNNPLIYKDPDGHSIIAAIAGFIGGITLKDTLIMGGIAATAIGLANIDYTSLANSLSEASNTIKSGISNNVADGITSTKVTDLYITLETQINVLEQGNISEKEKKVVLDAINDAVKEAAKNRTEKKSKEYDHTVYVLVDEEQKDKYFDIELPINNNYKELSGKMVKYVGRTVDPETRKKAHMRDKIKGKYKFVEVANNLTKYEARAYEQALILIYGMEEKGDFSGQLVNRRNEIAARNKNGIIYMDTLKEMFNEDEIRKKYDRIENEYFYYKEILQKNIFGM